MNRLYFQDFELVPVLYKPDPSASKLRHSGRHELFFKFSIRSEGVIDELVDFGRSNLANYSLQASIQKSGAALGLPERAPFDRILVSAATDRFPDELFTQLANEGIMVLVIRDAVVRLQKFPGFAFVPLKR